MTLPSDQQPAINMGVSDRALQIAKAIDRLAPGYTYSLKIKKPETKALDWIVEINRDEKIQTLTLTYLPE